MFFIYTFTLQHNNCKTRVLKEVARIATDTLKDYFVCRYGGEEFIVIAKIDDMNNVFNSLDKYRLAIEKNKFEFNNMSAHLTITTGLTEYKDDISIEKWIDLADEKLYKGKNSGKNQIVMQTIKKVVFF